MKHLKIFETSDPYEGKYLILGQRDQKTLLKIGNKERNSNIFEYSCLYNYIFYKGCRFGNTYILYNYRLYYFFSADSNNNYDTIFNILWKGEDEKEAIEMFDMIDTINKYNL